MASDTVVFIPAWNEERALPGVLDELRAGLPAADVLVPLFYNSPGRQR